MAGFMAATLVAVPHQSSDPDSYGTALFEDQFWLVAHDRHRLGREGATSLPVLYGLIAGKDPG